MTERNIFKISVLLIGMASLSGCHQAVSYDYLMEHPTVLQQEYEHCQSKTTEECAVIVQAAEDFRSLVQQCANDPESFGLQIMKAQQNGDRKKVRVLYAVVSSMSVE